MFFGRQGSTLAWGLGAPKVQLAYARGLQRGHTHEKNCEEGAPQRPGQSPEGKTCYASVLFGRPRSTLA